MEDELDAFLNGDVEDTSHVQADDQADSEETQAQGDEHSGDDAAAEADGQDEGDQPKPKKQSVQDRIDELTRDKHAERRAREAAERRLAELEARVQPKTHNDQPQEDAEPDPAAYKYGETDPGYIRDLGKFTARQEFLRLAAERERETAIRTVEQTWEQRQAEFAKAKPDFYDVMNGDWVCTPAMADTIRTSDDGAAVAYHLAQNPAEARRIAALNPLAQVREIGKLEARLSAPPPPQTKTVSDAPPPPSQARGVSGRFAPPPDTDDLDAFEREYFARR